MSGKYAQQTTVSSEQSRAEIERTLRRYGADDFAYASSRERAMIGFTAEERQVRFVIALPDPSAREFTHTAAKGLRRSSADADRAWEQAVRQKWRALALMVKAKLEAVESGIVTFEQEFLPHIMLPTGQTVYEQTAAAIDHAYKSGQVRPLLQIEGH